jgi:hypothetical protein
MVDTSMEWEVVVWGEKREREGGVVLRLSVQ